MFCRTHGTQSARQTPKLIRRYDHEMHAIELTSTADDGQVTLTGDAASHPAFRPINRPILSAAASRSTPERLVVSNKLPLELTYCMHERPYDDSPYRCHRA